MRALVLLCLAGLVVAADRSKRAPDDDGLFFWRAVTSPARVQTRTVAPARTVVNPRRTFFYYNDDDDFDFDRKKRSADFDFDFDDDDDFRVYRPVTYRARAPVTYSTQSRTSFAPARSVAPVRSAPSVGRTQYYYVDDDVFDHDRKKRSADFDFDFDDDDFRVYRPVTYRTRAPVTYSAQSRTVSAPVRPVRTQYYYVDDDVFDHDRKKRSADFDSYDDDDDYKFVVYTQPRYTSVPQARTSVAQAPTYYYYYDDK